MKLTFLGTGAGNYQGDRRHMSSVFLDGVLLDCGAGAMGRLYGAGLQDRVEGIVVSHLHTDHIAGVFDFLLHAMINGRKRPLTILSPPGLAPILRAMTEVGAMVKDPAELYEFRLVEGLEPAARIGSWQVRSVPLHHTVYNLGYVLTRDDTSVFYTGDTRQPSVPEGLRADVVIHESTYADRYAELAYEFGHSTASQAANAALQLKARRLFLTHLGSREGTDTEVLHEARAAFPDSTIAEDRGQYEF